MGRHTILTATRINTTQVEIAVGSQTIWTPSDPVLERGLDGLRIDLDASDEAGTLYTITSNAADSLIIEDATLGDTELTALTGKDLIGVHTFDRLAVRNGAAADFGADRVVINNAVIGDAFNAVHLRFGQMNGAALQILLQQLGSTSVEFDDATIGSLNMTDSTVTVTGDLTVTNSLVMSNTAYMFVAGNLNVNGDIALGATATLQAVNATATNLLIDGATMEVGTLNIINDITLLNNGVLTVPDPSTVLWQVYPLDITAGGMVRVSLGASINVDGKGYPTVSNLNYTGYGGPDFTRNANMSCHAGLTNVVNTCSTYGRLEQARFAGSGGGINIYYTATGNGYGGGIIRMTAGSLENNATISANGNSGYQHGAGGAIHINANSISGTGFYSANGGDGGGGSSDALGGGGRISLYLPDSTANNADMVNVTAQGGASAIYSSTGAGAGTVYVKYTNETYGHLIVDNGGNTAPALSTPVRQIGQRIIASLTDQTGGLYNVSLGANSAVHINEAAAITTSTVNPDTAVNHHPFTLSAARNINIAVNKVDFRPHVYLLKNNAGILSRVTDTFSYSVETISINNYALQPGEYVIAVGSSYLQTYDAISGSRSQTSNYAGSYTLKVNTIGDTWRATDPIYGWGLEGLEVSFDLVNPGLITYPVTLNDEESLTVQSGLDLTIQSLTDFVGVHRFQTLTVKGGANVDFGQDVVIIEDIPGSIIEADSAVTANTNSVLP